MMRVGSRPSARRRPRLGIPFLALRRTPSYRHRADPVQEPGSSVGHVSIEAEGGTTTDKLFEENTHDKAAQARSHAEMRTMAERNLRIRIATDVEIIGSFKDLLIPICRRETQENGLALLYVTVGKNHIPDGSPSEVDHG